MALTLWLCPPPREAEYPPAETVATPSEGKPPAEKVRVPGPSLSPSPSPSVVPPLGPGGYCSPHVGQEKCPAQGLLGNRVGQGVAPGDYRVALEVCPDGGACARTHLPAGGGTFRLEASRTYWLLAFLDRDGDGGLDLDEPRASTTATAPASGLALWVR